MPFTGLRERQQSEVFPNTRIARNKREVVPCFVTSAKSKKKAHAEELEADAIHKQKKKSNPNEMHLEAASVVNGSSSNSVKK